MLDVTSKDLLAQVDETENDLRDKKIQMIKAKASATSSSPSSAAADVPLNIVGTGSIGYITESNPIKAKAKSMVAARMGKITGKSSIPTSPSTINTEAEIDKINEEREEYQIIYRLYC